MVPIALLLEQVCLCDPWDPWAGEGGTEHYVQVDGHIVVAEELQGGKSYWSLIPLLNTRNAGYIQYIGSVLWTLVYSVLWSAWERMGLGIGGEVTQVTGHIVVVRVLQGPPGWEGRVTEGGTWSYCYHGSGLVRSQGKMLYGSDPRGKGLGIKGWQRSLILFYTFMVHNIHFQMVLAGRLVWLRPMETSNTCHRENNNAMELLHMGRSV